MNVECYEAKEKSVDYQKAVARPCHDDSDGSDFEFGSDRDGNKVEAENTVTLKMKLLDWHFTDFEVTLPVSTKICNVKNIVRQKHGKVDKLVLCKWEFRQENELLDDRKTLSDYGIGPHDCQDDQKITICYNFKPVLNIANKEPDPILLSIMN